MLEYKGGSKILPSFDADIANALQKDTSGLACHILDWKLHFPCILQ